MNGWNEWNGLNGLNGMEWMEWNGNYGMDGGSGPKSMGAKVWEGRDGRRRRGTKHGRGG